MKPLSLSKPHVIVMVGIPGSGKSFFAEHFANTFKAPVISYDQLHERIFSDPMFTKDEDSVISDVAQYMLGEALKTNQTIVYDARANTRTERTEIVRKAKAAGYEPLIVWVQTDQTTSRRRLIKLSKEKAVISPEQFDASVRKFTAPYKTENVVVISGKHTYTSQLKIVLKRLAESQPAPKAPPSAAVEPVRGMPRPRGVLIR